MKPKSSPPPEPKPADVQPRDLKTLKGEIIRRYPPHYIDKLVRPSVGGWIQSLVDWISSAPAGVSRGYVVNVVMFPFDISKSLEGKPLVTVTLDVYMGADAETRTLIGRALASDGFETSLLLRVETVDPTKAYLAWWREDGSQFYHAPLYYPSREQTTMYAIWQERPGSSIPLLFTVTFVRQVSSP